VRLASLLLQLVACCAWRRRSIQLAHPARCLPLLPLLAAWCLCYSARCGNRQRGGCSPCHRTSSDKQLSGALQRDGTVTPQSGRHDGLTLLSVRLSTSHRRLLRQNACRPLSTDYRLRCIDCTMRLHNRMPASATWLPGRCTTGSKMLSVHTGTQNPGAAPAKQGRLTPPRTRPPGAAPHSAAGCQPPNRSRPRYQLWYRVQIPDAAARSLRRGCGVQALHHAAPQAAREVRHVLDAGAGRAARRVGRQVQGLGRVCSPAAARAVAGRRAGSRRARLRAGRRGACGGAGPLRGPPARARVQAARRGAAADRGRPGPQLAQRRARQRARHRRQPLRQPACAHTAGVGCPVATADAWTIWPSYAGAGPPQLAHRRASACLAPAAGRRACQS